MILDREVKELIDQDPTLFDEIDDYYPCCELECCEVCDDFMKKGWTCPKLK